MEYLLLGSTTVTHDGRLLALGGLRQRSVLAALLLSANLTVDIDTLTDHVWDGSPPAKSITSLRAYVANLRRILSCDGRTDRLVTDGHGYRLHLGQDRLDIRRFEVLIGQGKRLLEARDPAGAAQMLTEALGLWRGNPLVDFRDLSFACHEIHRMEALRSDAVEARYEAELLLGRDAELIPGLEKEVAANPLREQLWGQLMLAMYRGGRRADALAAYRRLHSILEEELGIRPSESLDRLAEKIRCDSAGLNWKAPATRVAVDSGTTAATLFGRSSELTRLHDAVISAADGCGAIAMMTGDCGVGKTALAKAAARVADQLGMSSYWVGHAHGVRVPPLWTWTQALNGMNSGNAPTRPNLPTADPPNPGVSDKDRRSPAHFTAIEAMATSIIEAVARRPTVIVVDDLHRADPASRDVLGLLASAVTRMPLLILATWQSGGLNRVLHEREFTRLLHRCDVTMIPLRGIDREATAHLIESVSGISPTIGLAGSIETHTRGNPFYIKELTRLLVDSDNLDELTQTIAGEVVPDTVSTIIRSRMAQLPRATKAILSVAALLGIEFSAIDIADVLALPDPDVTHQLEPALRTGLIEAVTPLQFRFSPGIFRDAVAAHITGTARAQLHADVARMYAARPSRAVEHCFAAADHAWRAGAQLPADAALALLDRALTSAWRSSAYPAVADLSMRALDVCARLDPDRLRREREAAFWLQLVSARAVTSGQNSREVREALSRLAEIEDRSDRFTLEAAFRCLEASGSGRYCEAAILADGLVAMYQDGKDPIAGSAGYYLRGLIEFFRGNLYLSASAIDVLMYHLPTVDWQHNGHLAAFDVRGYGVAVWTAALRGQPSAVAAWTHSGLTLADSRGDEFGRAIVRISALQANAIMGQWDGTEDMAREVYTELTDLGVSQLAASARLIEAWAGAMGRQRLDTCDIVRQAIAAHCQDGSRIFLPMYYALLADTEFARGRPDAAAAALDIADKISAATGERVWDHHLAARRKMLCAATSRPDLIRT